MTTQNRSAVPNAFKPRRQALALEPRILFDGAAAAAADQQHQDNGDSADANAAHTTPADARSEPGQQPSATRHLLVLDSRIEGREQLSANLPGNVQVLVVEANQDGLAAISTALAQLGQVDSIQILSHGASGEFTLGKTTLSADNIGQFSQPLSQWSQSLSEGADIQLYGCQVGAGSDGRSLVDELSRWTGADVGASSDNTGSARAGGDWDLEVSRGTIDQPTALSAFAMAGYERLLAAGPNTDLSGGASVLLGDTFTFTVTFTNSTSDTGYAPFVDLFFPATGKDGAGSQIDDGITFVSATYLGQSLTAHVLTFDANGRANHPLAVGSDGKPLVINAADFGMRAGDQMVVVELPFASVSQGQPAIPIQVTATLSNLADTDFSFTGSTPDLTIRARSGFQYGNDSLNNPATDPSILEPSANADRYVVHPTVITVDQVVTTPEGETATGPNFKRDLDVTITPANSQTLTNVVIVQPVPNNVIVTAITPGGGGTLTSITLYDGRTVTDPNLIRAILALNNDSNLSNDLYVREFSVSYPTLSGPTSTNVQFFVPDDDANGVPVINAVTGDDVTITFDGPTATGSWQPLDPRDATSGQIQFDGQGQDVSFVAKSITLQKQVSVTVDGGAAGISPGDTLTYILNIALSDYFAFGKTFLGNGSFVIADSLTDGQALVSESATLTITVNGFSQTIPLVIRGGNSLPDGSTPMVFDIAQSMREALSGRGWLNGDLAFDDLLQGATLAVISYQARVGQSYTLPAGAPHSEINEGDPLGNNATTTATVLLDPLNLSGENQSDSSNTLTRIPTSQVQIDLSDLNGNGAPAPSTELRPGDRVTFRLSYDLVTGDYENFKLTAYLPLPLFDLSGVDLNSIWRLATGNTNPNSPISVTLGPGNSLVFTFADYVNPGVNGSRIAIDFTLTVSDQPFADQRAFNVLGESSQTRTLDKSVLLTTDDVTLIASVAEPVLTISHGVVSTSHGTVSGTTGSWNPPGGTGIPFNGSITDITAVNGNVSGIDANDRLRLATAIENHGGGNAFDVSTRITLPPGLSFVGGSLSAANLLIYRGDGTRLIAGTHYTVNNATNTITFIDGAGVGALLAGRPGTAADNSGANLVVITYDVNVASAIAASATLQSTAQLTRYASVEGGQNFLGTTPLSDLANQQVAAPAITKTYAGGSLDNSDSSASHTTGANLVVGESMLYDIVVTLPEGTTQNLRIDDLIPPGMRLDTTFNNQGYLLITTAGGVLAQNFGGTITVGSLSAPSGTLGGDGVDARFVFTVATTTGDNNTGNNSFVIRLRLVASNVTANQTSAVRLNDATLSYSDPDGDTPNGSTPINRDVVVTGSKPSVTIQEPTLQLDQQLITPPGLGFDLGDPVEYSITISNGSASSDYDAFDIAFTSVLPSELDQLRLVSVIYTVNGVSTTITGSFSLDPTGRTLVNTGNVDIAKGGTVVIRVSGVVNASGASVAQFDNQASVRWTSLNGTRNGVADPAGERTGEDGRLNSGVLNDYRRDNLLVIPVAQGIKFSRVGGLSDTSAPNPTNALQETVAVGEIIRYRATVLVPEGNNPNYQLVITLGHGLTLADLSTLRIGFISDGGLVTSLSDLISSGTLQIIGNEDSPEAQFITPDLSGAAPTGVLNSKYVLLGNDGNGNQTVTLNLGNITNGPHGSGDDGNDDDLEGIVLEFNARVDNIADNQAGVVLGASIQDHVNGNLRATSDVLTERIVEAGFTGLNKQVTDFTPNPGSALGNATVSVSFTASGGLPAYDVHLSDGFPTGRNYNLISVTIGGTTYGPGNLPAGVTFSTTGGLTVDIARIDVGTQVRVVYSVDVPNGTSIASSDASLSWSSLPETFTSWGGSPVGTDSGTSGERTGVDGPGPDASTLNNYVLREGAGLGIISGTLWNDTGTAATAPNDANPDPDPLPGTPAYELAVPNQTINLIWAGNDGVLGNADDKTFSTTTDSNGRFTFGVLPSGLYRLDAPTTVNSISQFGELRLRIDTDGGTLGQVGVTLGEGSTAQANSGYVELNDAPVNSLPGLQRGQEDTPLAIPGISVSDVDAERDPDVNGRAIQVTLTVVHGTLSLTGPTTGVTVTATGATLVLLGRIADINAALASLSYLGNLNFNGNDFLEVTSNDLGNYGDFDGNGVPGQATDARSDRDFLVINLNPVNDRPQAVPDNAVAIEAGGSDNRLLGVDPRGNLLDNDTDVDIATNGDILNVVSVTSPLGGVVTVPALGSIEVIGKYGKLVIQANGAYQYIIDNNNAEVQALRLAGDQLTEVFNYTIADIGIGGAPLQANAALTVIIQGANDAPDAENDTGTAIEKGGINNTDNHNANDKLPPGFPVNGADATGNVLSNDNDVDGGERVSDPINYGERITVTGVRPLRELATGALIAVPAGGSVSIAGTYGTLTIAADGTYTYVIDDNNTAVQRLGPNDTLTDFFSYQVSDALGLNDLAELRITVVGNYDNPVASNDQASAQAGASNAAPESNPVGNVILFPSRPGTINQPGGNGVDLDVDGADRPSSVLLVNGVRNGPELAGGTLTAVSGGAVVLDATFAQFSDGTPVGSPVSYGTLTINPDGSFSFDVNSDNPAIVNLARGATMNVIFTYQVVDSAGLTDTAQLVIIVRGENNPPHAQDSFSLATEKGGINNGTPGVDPGVPPAPGQQVTFVDPDGDPVSVTSVRTGPEGGSGRAGTVGTALSGLYGALTINSDGTYSYVIDNDNAAVQALRAADDLLIEVFTYGVTDSNGESDEAQIVIVIRGQNDNPVATDNTAEAVEAGGVNNASGGVDPTGDVLVDDSDVDGGARGPIDYGETKAVVSVRTGAIKGAGTAGSLGSELHGTYGWLTLNADGSYSYRLDNSMAAVQALRPGNTLIETFNYSIFDTAGATDTALLTITIKGSNDAPVANNDNALAVEAGGLNNTAPGSNPSGNVLGNDIDVDRFGETLSVIGVAQGLSNGSVGSSFAGQYGSLTLNADGSYTYLVDNDDPLVQALRTANTTLRESFTYTIRDLAGATSTATLTITIQGRNDNPQAVNDSAVAVEAGGTNNGTAGTNPTGNLLVNDRDVDAGDGKTVNGIRSGSEAAGGTFTAVNGSQLIRGTYGSLTVFANGDYRYQVDNTLAVVQALKPGDRLQETFTYRMRDAAGAEDAAQFSLTIEGAWDAPVARDNVNIGVADNGDGLVLNPSGNVLPNDSDVDQGDRLTVTAIRTGPQLGTGVAGTVGNVLLGQYGTLVLNADGSYTYTIDTNNPAVLALDILQTLVDHFTYEITDLGGLTDLAQLSIIVIGRNDAPDGLDNNAIAIEAGGLNNATPGLNPNGNVLNNDGDLENDVLKVSAIRTGSEAGSGTSGTLGNSLRGRYGDLVMNADGSWTYTVDNSLAAVQALRTSGQVLVDIFTYTVVDPHQADDTAQLRITIDGRNDTPIAVDDATVAIEAGGVGNKTPGLNPSGNVLANDNDVDSAALGETRQVLSVRSETGNNAVAGQVLSGRYGSLVLNADGSYTYQLDNANPVVQALRNAGQTLREVFTYRMRDTAGAESEARLNVLIQGANDTPVARDDSTVASDQTPSPQAVGNVLPNDSDVDAGEQLSVSGIRTGAEADSGTLGVVGQPLAGRYGTLVINADGSYTYSIDLNNPEVLAAAGLGQVLQDVFTYTLSDRAGATDLAQLTITLDIAAPFIPAPAGPFFGRDTDDPFQRLPLPDVDPVVFIGPVVERQERVLELSGWQADGSNLSYGRIPEIVSETLNQRLGLIQGQFVARAVQGSRQASENDMAWILGRQSRINLSADGLLPDPSVFATDGAHLTQGDAQLPPPNEARIAPGFRAQLREAAERLRALDNRTRE